MGKYLHVSILLLITISFFCPPATYSSACKWRYHNPLIPMDDINDIWVNTGSDIYTAGDNGTILRYNGTAWTQMYVPTNNSLNAVWGTSSSDIFAAGANATLLHYNGARWSFMTAPPDTNTLTGIWGSSSTDVFAVGINNTFMYYGPLIIRYDGSAWSTMYSGMFRLMLGVWGTSATNVFAVGYKPAIPKPPESAEGYIFEYNGVSWYIIESGNSIPISIHGTSSTNIYVNIYNVSSHKYFVWQFDGVTWEPMTAQPVMNEFLSTIHANAPDDIYVTGGDIDGNMIAHYDGSTWSKLISTEALMRAVAGTPSGEMYFGGTSGIMYRKSGSTWDKIFDATIMYGKSFDIWGSSDTDIYVTGENGKLLHYNGTTYSRIKLPTTVDLYGIWGSSVSDVFVVGNVYNGSAFEGKMYHYDGILWNEMMALPDVKLSDIDGVAADEVFAVGSKSVYNYTGTTWWEMYRHSRDLHGVYVVSAADVYATAWSSDSYYTDIIHYDGLTWTLHSILSSPGHPKKIWGTGPDNLYAADYDIQHYDGTTWTVDYKEPGDCYDIWGSGPDDIRVSGRGIHHFDGSTWSTEYSDGYKEFYAIHGFTPDNMFICSSHGEVLQYSCKPVFFTIPDILPWITVMVVISFSIVLISVLKQK